MALSAAVHTVATVLCLSDEGNGLLLVAQQSSCCVVGWEEPAVGRSLLSPFTRRVSLTLEKVDLYLPGCLTIAEQRDSNSV